MSRIFIIGFGQVGREIMPLVKKRWPGDKTWIVDHDPKALTMENGSYGISVLEDGPRFLARNQAWIRDEDWIIPALPIHLAWHWLYLNLKASFKTRSLRPDHLLDLKLPFKKKFGPALLVSYADFICPNHCPAPLGRCFKTREERPSPLWRFLETCLSPKGNLHVIESRQMAPGMGGYPFGELKKALHRAWQSGPPFFLATACRCHGIINGLTWRPEPVFSGVKQREAVSFRDTAKREFPLT